jgi:cytochrome c oxidase assembly protein subunit 15
VAVGYCPRNGSYDAAVTPRLYARLTVGALAALAAIVVTGGAVRVTGSGLGCPDWPQCGDGRLVAPLSYHPMIEFGNRVVTGLVSVAVIAAVLGSLARRPRRRELTYLSLGLVGGVVAQILLGAVVVYSHLWPPFVMGHFVVSMALLANAVVLVARAGAPDGPTEVRPVVGPAYLALGRVLLGAVGVAILLGTVVTGSGPHAGSNDGELVDRLPFALPDVARVHGIAVMLVITVALVLAVRVRRNGAPAEVQRRSVVLLAVLVAQATVGYVQYFTGVPAVLVAVHIAGATAVWIATLRLVLSMRVRVPVTRPVAVAA